MPRTAMSAGWMAALVAIGFLATLALIGVAIVRCFQCVIIAILIMGVLGIYGIAYCGVIILRAQTERLRSKVNRP